MNTICNGLTGTVFDGQGSVGITIVNQFIVCGICCLSGLYGAVRSHISDRSCLRRSIRRRIAGGQLNIADYDLGFSCCKETNINIILIQLGQFIAIITMIILLSHCLAVGICIAYRITGIISANLQMECGLCIEITQINTLIGVISNHIVCSCILAGHRHTGLQGSHCGLQLICRSTICNILRGHTDLLL